VFRQSATHVGATGEELTTPEESRAAHEIASGRPSGACGDDNSTVVFGGKLRRRSWWRRSGSDS
jgi:hypothetical protein